MKSKITNAMSKSQTLSQFQSVMQELDTFGRGKDKAKRKSRGGGLATAGGVGLAGAGGLAVAEKKLGNAAVKQGKIAITSKKVGDMGRKAYESGGKSKRGLRSALQNTIKEADSTMVRAATKARNLNVGKNIAKAGKVGAAVAAGGLLAGAAAKALRNRKKNK